MAQGGHRARRPRLRPGKLNAAVCGPIPASGKGRTASKMNASAHDTFFGYRAPIFFARARWTKHAAFLRARRSHKSPAARTFGAAARQCCSCWLQAANANFTRSLCKEQSNMLLVLFAAGSRRSYSVFLQQRKKDLLPRERRSFLGLYYPSERKSRRPTPP